MNLRAIQVDWHFPFFYSFIYSLSKYLLTTYYMVGTALSDEDMIMNNMKTLFNRVHKLKVEGVTDIQEMQ